MTLEYYRDYCLAKPGVTEDTPFDQDALCFRVGNKIFSICSISAFQYINLKCDPERAVELRLILELADHSYELIFGSLTKKLQAEIRP